MSLITTIANVTSDADARLVPEATTQRTFRESRSSRELFEEYLEKSPEVLRKWKITRDNYVRTPNGTGDYAGLWVPPYPLDIWDYWVNYRFSGESERTYVSADDFDYIPNMTTTASVLSLRNPPREGEYVYRATLIYLWDFVYNPEVNISRFSTGAQDFVRKRPFPVYLDDAGAVSDEADVIPPYLPDATFPRNFAETYPWAAWEMTINLRTAQIQGDLYIPLHATRAQRQTYVRAHGTDATLTNESANAYRFTPHDATKELGKVIRPLYPIEQATLYKGFVGVPYAPLVVRDLSPFKTNGWILCYRQAVRYSTDVYFPKSKLWDAFKEANRILHVSPGMSIDYAVALALPRQSRLLWPKTDLKDVPQTWEMPIPEEMDNTTAAADVRLLREVCQKSRTVQDVYELATAVTGPVMEATPYKVIAIQIFELQPIERYLVTFVQDAPWVLTVPPLISVTKTSALEYYSTDAVINWHSGFDQQTLDIMLDEDDVASSHQIRVTASNPGQSVVTAKVTRALRGVYTPYRVTYVFRLSWFSLSLKVFELDHSLASSAFDLRQYLPKENVYYRWTQLSESVLYMYADVPERIKSYIEETWPRFEVKDAWPTSDVEELNVSVDFSRPVIIVRDTEATNTGVFFVFVFKLQPVVMRVNDFGERVHLRVVYNTQRDEMRWTRPLGAATPHLDIMVVSPRQLGAYVAEIRRRGSVDPMPDYVVPFSIELVWNSPIPLGYIQRTVYDDWVEDNPAVLHKYTVRDTTDIETTYDLRETYDGPFFRAMIEAWGRNYMIDLRNYAQRFPHVLTYCQLMDEVADTLGVAIVAHMDPGLRQFLPRYMSEPVLQLPARESNPDTASSPYAYVIFDPFMAQWINILSLEQKPIESSWLPAQHFLLEGLYSRVQKVYPHVSVELEEKGRVIPEAPSEEWTEIKSNFDKSERRLESIRADLKNARIALHNDIRKRKESFARAKKETFGRYPYEIVQRLIFDASVNYEREVVMMRKYAQFVTASLASCFYYDIDGAQPRTTRAVATLKEHVTNNILPSDVWLLIKDMSVDSVYMSAAIKSPSGDAYLIDQMHADGYVTDGGYVFCKFILFVCRYSLISIPAEVRRTLIVRYNRLVGAYLQRKNLTMSEIY